MYRTAGRLMVATTNLERCSRLFAVDALRGIAAMAVVLFHYTTKFAELYGGNGSPSVSFAYGHYGVNLFFMVSGFVIFMTLERTRQPMDFIVSRFSRLFPSYWVAVALTFTVVAWAGLPGKEVTAWQALGNGLMVHGLFGIPSVDGVYWTLEVELLFYAWMLLLFVTGNLHRVHLWLCGLMGLRLVYFAAAVGFGVDLSWTLSHLLLLKYIPWFALGICVYQMSQGAAAGRAMPTTVVAALLVLVIVDGWRIGVLGGVFTLLVWAAATGRATWLNNRVLVFLGAISYPLYLVHENIGWVVERALQRLGWSFDSAVIMTTILAIGLATLLTWTIERPAMRAIRARYARRGVVRPVKSQ